MSWDGQGGLTLRSRESYTYNGKARQPSVTVRGLTLNKDYAVAFTDSCIDVGTHQVTITGYQIQLRREGRR